MEHYSVGVPYGGVWKEVLNSDDARYGGSGKTNGDLKAAKTPSHGRDFSISFRLPPLAVMAFEGEIPPKQKKEAKKTAAAKTAVGGKKK
jgi:1,4-alpha-glucan branching enzyme